MNFADNFLAIIYFQLLLFASSYTLSLTTRQCNSFCTIGFRSSHDSNMVRLNRWINIEQNLIPWIYINSKMSDPNRILLIDLNIYSYITILCHLLINYIWINTAITRSTSHNESASPIGGSASAGYDNPTFRRGFSFTSSAPFSYLTGGNPNSRYWYNYFSLR